MCIYQSFKIQNNISENNHWYKRCNININDDVKNNLLAPPNALTKRPPFAYPTTNKTEEKDLIYDLSTGIIRYYKK